MDLSKAKSLLVHGVNGLALAAVSQATTIFHNGMNCLQSAYASVGAAAPTLKGVADSLASNATTAGAGGDWSYLAIAAAFTGISAAIGFGASKLPIWPSTPSA